ncbi:hypothetical protein FRC09_005181 [Ceratobasidium sp. 395]|nr:hypothetical protein FRC09_005181 [Ceratobasidium sp. 395]
MLKELKKSMRRVKDVAHSRTQSQIPTPVPTQSPATGTTVQDATSPKIDNSATKAPPGLISPDPEHPSAIQDPNQPIPASSGPSSVGEQSAGHLSWAGLKSLISVLEAGSGAFGPLKSAIGGLSQCIEIFEHKNQIGEEYKKLRAELNAILKDLSNYLGGSSPPTMTPVIENIASSIEREVNTTIEKEGRHKLGRYAGAAEDEDEILECYRNIQTLLGRLTLNVNMSIWKSIDEQTTDLRLDRLPNAPMAMYRSAASESLRRTGCTPNTRVDVIKQLLNWAHDRNGEKVYWLNGMAGTGKTTIAYTFCDHLRRNHQLGASFFCSRQLPECRDVNRIVPSISYQLSLFSLPFRHALSEVLEKHRDIHNQLLQDQFEYLVAAPLLRVAHTFGADVTIVIDALDECDDRGGVERVLAVLLSCAPALSVNFLVTSRPEPEILDHMRSREDRGRPSELRLHDLDRSVVQQDITAYLEDMLPRDKVSNAQITELARRSGVLFIYASTVVRYIGHNKFVWSPSRLHAVLEASATTTIGSDRDIDKLYTTILNTALNDDSLERSEMEVRRDVLRHVVCAREPLSVVTIAELLGLGDTGLIQAALGPLLSVLNVSDTDGLVTMLHESFPNYILNRNRSGDFHCDARQHHARMAQLCFDAIKVPTPPFNICKLESSYVFDKDVPNIEERVGKVISKGLMYACQYWGAHLELAQAASYLTDALHELLSVRLLLWMEVLNLKNRMHEGVVMLHKIQIWCKVSSLEIALIKTMCLNKKQAEVNFKGVYPLALDAYRFASVASSSYLLRSTPHIYISALSFWPQSRPVSRCYLPKTSGLVRVTGTALARQELAPVTIYAHSEVTCIAYSNDGVHIASSHYDGSIWIWDARTGQTVGEPLNGHILFAFSVVYSPDSAQIISGGHDRTIRIWDAQTHEIMGEPLRGHTGSVLWVTCSPDGIHLASGSEDKTIRIWNRHTGQLVGHPLEGHTDSVESVSYSPDGAYIASGSLDTTIRIWEVIAGTMVGDALKGHSDGVQSVAYSPNGAYVISGSVDASIYIWNARTGQTIGQLLEGHTSAINSVRYSPSGAHIISGSSDNTVCIWDAHSHRMIDRLNNHDDEVLSVSFSPDGAYIISCSPDRTIHVREANNHEVAVQAPPDHVYDAEVTTPIPPNPRPIFGSNDDVSGIWDETTSPAVWRLPEGHTDPVLSVACSPDGTYLASGSEDKTIRIWDARTGKMARQPLKACVLPPAPPMVPYVSGTYKAVSQ